MSTAETSADGSQMLCRGCAAKLPAATLEAALSTAGMGGLATAPEDAAVVPTNAHGQEHSYCRAWMVFPH